MQSFRRSRQKRFLIIGSIFFLPIIFIITTQVPTIIFTTIFFLLLFLSFLYLGRFFLNQTRLSFLLSCAMILWLFLRALQLRHWLYPLLILAIIISIELYFQKNSHL